MLVLELGAHLGGDKVVVWLYGDSGRRKSRISRGALVWWRRVYVGWRDGGGEGGLKQAARAGLGT